MSGATATKPVAEDAETAGMSKAAKGIILEQAAESNLVDQLFGDELDEEGNPTMVLKTEAEFKEYGQKVGKVLNNGAGKNRFHTFFQEAAKDIQDHSDSRTIKKIADFLLA